LVLVASAFIAWSRHAGAEPPSSNPPVSGAPRRTPSAGPLSIPFEKFVLKNGLEVILHQDHRLPRVAVNVWYHVGPANEPPGRSGFAHLFEHLMFEGSRHVGKNFDELLESVGATNVNGTTSWDRTNYYATAPREHLELLLWIESDRMGFLLDALTPEGLAVQKDVVKNERRQSYEAAPYGPSQLALYEALFPPGHPYRGAIIGSLADIGAATLEDAAQFFRSFYAPSNATLAIAGDLDVAQTRALVSRYFETLPSAPKPRAGHVPPPRLAGNRRIVVKEPVELARVVRGWLAPPAYGKDELPLELAVQILAGGKTSRLYQRLVVRDKIASSVEAHQEAASLASFVLVGATAMRGHSPEALGRALDEELGRLMGDGPSEQEVERARRALLVSLREELQELDGPGGETGRAGLLQRFNHYLGTPDYIEVWTSQLGRLTPADVKAAMQRHLSTDARVTVVTEPTAPLDVPVPSSDGAPASNKAPGEPTTTPAGGQP
jgi:zinc protease